MTRTITAVVALSLMAAGCSEPATESAAVPTALVSLAKVGRGGIAETVTLYGAAETSASARIALVAPIEANVVEIAAPVGTAVSAGQVVARLAPGQVARLDLARAESDARLATAALARAQRLRGDGLVSNAEVDIAQAAAQSALATRASLGARSGALVLRASGPGFVDTVPPAIGDLVAAGGVVATIARSGDVRARFGIDPALARRIGRGVRLRIVPTGGGAPFTAPVLSVDPVVDPTTRLASVYTLVPANAGIGPGEALTAEVRVSEAKAALTIPYAALLDEGGQPYVFVAERGVARRRDVVTGAAGDQQVAILKGLTASDAVVIAGGTALEDGMKVRTR